MDDASLDLARQWVAALEGDLGGTELRPPLAAVLGHPVPSGKARQVFVVTDGEVSAPDEVLQLVAAARRSTRVFSFGIGSGCSRYLVSGIADRGDGTASYVRAEDPDMKAKVIAVLAGALEPALTDVVVEFPGSATGGGAGGLRLATEQVPPMFRNRRHVLYAFAGDERALQSADGAGAKAKVRFAAPGADGQPQRHEVEVDLAAAVLQDGRTVHQLAAKARVKELEAMSVPSKPELVRLGVAFGIATTQTSFVCVDEDPTVAAATGPMAHRPVPARFVSSLDAVRPKPDGGGGFTFASGFVSNATAAHGHGSSSFAFSFGPAPGAPCSKAWSGCVPKKPQRRPAAGFSFCPATDAHVPAGSVSSFGAARPTPGGGFPFASTNATAAHGHGSLGFAFSVGPTSAAPYSKAGSGCVPKKPQRRPAAGFSFCPATDAPVPASSVSSFGGGFTFASSVGHRSATRCHRSSSVPASPAPYSKSGPKCVPKNHDAGLPPKRSSPPARPCRTQTRAPAARQWTRSPCCSRPTGAGNPPPASWSRCRCRSAARQRTPCSAPPLRARTPAVVLAVLREAHGSQRGDWALMARKAEHYLADRGFAHYSDPANAFVKRA